MRLFILAAVACAALSAAACADTEAQPAQAPSTTTSVSVAAPAPAPPPMDMSANVSPMPPTATATMVAPRTQSTTYAQVPSPTWVQTPSPTYAPVASPTYVATSGAPAPAPDNTNVNTRDRRATLTPMNQGNSADELRITAEIRRGVMGDGAMSFTAKNVKIITVGSKVTLRGPVNSVAERTAIENRARQTAGVTDVDDQLEVK